MEELGTSRQVKSADAMDRAQRKYRRSPKGRAAMRRYYRSPKGKRAIARYNSSLAGVERRNKYVESEKGRANAQRTNDTKRRRRYYARLIEDRMARGVCVLCGGGCGEECEAVAVAS